MIVRRWCAAGALTLTAVLCGCTSNSTELPALGGPKLSGPAGVAKSPEQQATEQATEAVNRYYELLSRVVTGAADPAELGTVVAGPYLEQLQREVGGLRAPDVRAEGKIRAASAAPTKVVAPQNEDKAPISGEASVELRVCEDRSGLKVTGPAAEQPPQTRLRRFQVINPGWPGQGWVVVRQYVPSATTGCDKQY